MKMQCSDILVACILVSLLPSGLKFCDGNPQFGTIPRSFWFTRLQQFAKAKYQKSSLEAFKSFSCLERKDQRYPDLNSNCTNYYRCLGGIAYSYACGSKKAFDMKRQECRPKAEMKCEDVPMDTTNMCSEQPDGFYPNYANKCSSYYKCNNKTLMEERECGPFSKWNLATKSCIADKKVFCLPPSCSGLKDGLYPTPRSSCFSYFSCKNGYRIDMACPVGLIFDYMKKKCIAEKDTICYENACQGKLNGKNPVKESQCNTFVDCFNGKLRHIEKCKCGYIFDGLSCSLKRNFSCIKRTHIKDSDCYRRPDGTYLTEDSNCRSFYRCRGRQVVGTFRCNQNLVFNGYRCVKNTNYICKYNLHSQSCINKIDGYYIVKKSSCRKFYKCYNFNKITEYSCPRKYSFDGFSCVDSKIFNCHSEK